VIEPEVPHVGGDADDSQALHCVSVVDHEQGSDGAPGREVSPLELFVDHRHRLGVLAVVFGELAPPQDGHLQGMDQVFVGLVDVDNHAGQKLKRVSDGLIVGLLRSLRLVEQELGVRLVAKAGEVHRRPHPNVPGKALSKLVD
jgi:hypothetical protein